MTTVVILAAGDGRRLRGMCPDGPPKPFMEIGGKPMVRHLLDSVPTGHPIVVVLSPVGRRLWNDGCFPDGENITTVIQETPAGTGDALRRALPSCRTERVLVVNADTPLLDIQGILSHSPSRPIAMFVARRWSMRHSGGMGRCVMDPMTGSWSIQEACTLTEPPHDDDYVNAGVYIMDRGVIEGPIMDLPVHGAECFLTDLISRIPTEAIIIPQQETHRFQGINTPDEYAYVSSIMP